MCVSPQGEACPAVTRPLPVSVPPAVLPSGLEGQLLPGRASGAHLLTSAPKSPRQPLAWDSRPHASWNPPAADATGVAGDRPGGPGAPAEAHQSSWRSCQGLTWPLQRLHYPPTPPYPGDPGVGPQCPWGPHSSHARSPFHSEDDLLEGRGWGLLELTSCPGSYPAANCSPAACCLWDQGSRAPRALWAADPPGPRRPKLGPWPEGEGPTEPRCPPPLPVTACSLCPSLPPPAQGTGVAHVGPRGQREGYSLALVL